MRAAGLVCATLLGSLCAAAAFGAASTAPEVRFDRDIRPILSENCFKCHGGDEGNRKGGLRLDRKEDLYARRGPGAPVVPGSLTASRMWVRISAHDAAQQMPPPSSGKVLSAKQKDLIRQWIGQGGKWSQHWAFVPPQLPPVPKVTNAKWVRNPIDAFVLARLEKEGLAPSPEADRVTLLRRLSLDLIGLPPTPEEVDAFLADKRPDAYERQVDRLLKSPHYGERWGRVWLDGARYADSDGFEKDKLRFVSFYRDWVINALNRDLPYDQFIIDQIAGDLLPNATQDQIVATGFLRNSMINEEGGVDPEQFRMEAMFDRMDALGKSVLGLTIQCAQCHSHKYDPLTQEEYYRMFAFLNNSHEANVAVYTPEQQMQREEIYRRTREIEARLQHENADWLQKMAAWEAKVRGDQPHWTIAHPHIENLGSGERYNIRSDGSILAGGYAPTHHTPEFIARFEPGTISAVRLEVLNDPNLPRGGPGRSIYGTFGLTEFRVEAAPADHPEQRKPVKIVATTADVTQPERELLPIFNDKSNKRRVLGPIEYAIDGKDETGWGIDVGPGRSNVPRKAVFRFEKPVEFPQGTVLYFRVTQSHGGWNSDDNQANNLGCYRFSVTGAAEATADPLPKAVREALAIPAEQRSQAQTAAIFSYWRTTVPEWRGANAQVEALWQDHPEPTTQLVFQERPEPRLTHTLQRGDFLKPVKVVEPDVPAFLHPLPAKAPRNRLTFAKWLVDRRSPTTARSLVNRVWQSYFGTGLVRTGEDLGFQSEPPSHPELLDWLAVTFMDPASNHGSPSPAKGGGGRGVGSPWSVKALHRLIVTSATYRQSSKVTAERYAKDPENRLLSRGARLRVDAELVRDVALSASGLLSPQIGGPSVFPPAPDFLFQPPASYGPKVWPLSTGPDRYRRGLYTFRYRSVPYPVLQAFDAPNGDQSCVRRSRSNTPLQALTTLNEPLFLDCARALALKTVTEGGMRDEDRLTYAFRRCLARKPTAEEAADLMALRQRQSERYAQGKLDPWTLAAPDEKSRPKLPAGTSPAHLAAWTSVCRVLLNLDETITKE